MTAQQIVDVLNGAVSRDSGAVLELMRQLVVINDALLDDPLIVCWGPLDSEDGLPRFGPLGLLNGIAQLDGELIEMVLDTSGPEILEKFQLRAKPSQTS